METIKIYPIDSINALLYDEDNQIVWESARGYTGDLFTPVSKDSHTITLRSDKNSGMYRIYRGSMLFNTDIIPSNAVIKTASVNVYRVMDYDNDPIVFTQHTRASTLDFIDADWQIQQYGAELSRGILSDNQYTKFELNESDIPYLDQNGYIDIGVVTTADFDNIDRGTTITGSAFYSVNIPEIEKRPYLEVTYEIPDEVEKDMFDLIRELIAAVREYGFVKNVEYAYMANLKKVEGMLESARYTPAENQVSVFVKKLKQDLKHSDITQTQYDDLLARANALLETIPDDAN